MKCKRSHYLAEEGRGECADEEVMRPAATEIFAWAILTDKVAKMSNSNTEHLRLALLESVLYTPDHLANQHARLALPTMLISEWHHKENPL